MANSGLISPEMNNVLMDALQSGATKTANVKLQQASKDKNDAALTQAAESFEAVYLSEMVRPMFETVAVDDQFGGGKGEDTFRSFLVQEYGKLMAKTGGIGLASHIKEALINAQSTQSVKETDQ